MILRLDDQGLVAAAMATLGAIAVVLMRRGRVARLHDAQRRRIEAALRDSTAKLEAALASMNDAAIISDAEGRFIDFNEAFVAMHRFRSRAECSRTLADYQGVLEVCTENGAPVPVERWAIPRALRGETASNVEYRLRRKDTGHAWVGSYSFAPIRGSDGRIAGAVVTGRDITVIKKTQAELAASHAQLRRLIANQHRVEEDERKRIARELHDDLQQSLAAIRMDVAVFGERSAGGRDDIDALLTRIDGLAKAALDSTRRIVNDLRPEVLETLGLVAALEAMCAQHRERTGSECRLEVGHRPTLDARLRDPVVSAGLYRIAQEALNNAAKHANASVVTVGLDGADDGRVRLRVGDNGSGMRQHERRLSNSFGLQGIGERVEALGGQWRIDSDAGRGTTLDVRVPCLGPAAAKGSS